MQSIGHRENLPQAAGKRARWAERRVVTAGGVQFLYTSAVGHSVAVAVFGPFGLGGQQQRPSAFHFHSPCCCRHGLLVAAAVFGTFRVSGVGQGRWQRLGTSHFHTPAFFSHTLPRLSLVLNS